VVRPGKKRVDPGGKEKLLGNKGRIQTKWANLSTRIKKTLLRWESEGGQECRRGFITKIRKRLRLKKRQNYF